MRQLAGGDEQTLLEVVERAAGGRVVAALCAEGTSIIGDAYQIDKGYERIDERLRGLGARIERVEG